VTDQPAADNIRISYSSSNTYQGCQRKFYYHKVIKIDNDPDFTENSKALRIGKAFHQILELCRHDFKAITNDIVYKSFEENKLDCPTEQGLVLGMAKKYSVLHKKSGLALAGIEIEIGDRVNYIGFVDAVMVDTLGAWWIVDLKTAGKLNNSLLSRLSKDPQLNIYSHYTDQIAEVCKLKVENFAGVRYRVTTKALIKRSVKERMGAFVQRVYDRVESFDIGIPAKDLMPQETYNYFMSMLKKMRALQDTPENEISQNFTYCESYFKPCPYWSRCYDKTFTEAGAQYTIHNSDTIPNLNFDELDLI
jgi:hypothetical protein